MGAIPASTARNVLMGVGGAAAIAGGGVAAYAGGVAVEAQKEHKPSGPPHNPSMQLWLAGPAIAGVGVATIGAVHARHPKGALIGGFVGVCASAAPLVFGGLLLSAAFDL